MTSRTSKRPDGELEDNAMDPVTAQAHAQAGDPAGQPKAHRKEDDQDGSKRNADGTEKKAPNPVNAKLADQLSKIADDLNKSQHSDHDVGRANALALVQRAVQALNADLSAPQPGVAGQLASL